MRNCFRCGWVGKAVRLASLAILIPTYRRVDRLRGVVENAQTPDATVYLVMEPDEAVEIDGAVTLTCDEGFGTYAASINFAYRHTSEKFLFAGADDLRFEDGWFGVASELLDDFDVVGTNDLGNPSVLAGDHATHYLVSRRYLDGQGGVFDEGPGSFLFEGYDHNWTDTEFVETAKHRGVWSPCLGSVVEHCHPAWGKAERDATYGKSFAREREDAVLAAGRLKEMRSC